MTNQIVPNNESPAEENNRNVTPQPPKEKQTIPERGEEYIRESGKIEDYPGQDGSSASARFSDQEATFGAKRSYDSIY